MLDDKTYQALNDFINRAIIAAVQEGKPYNTAGWDWIRENIHELDFIFYSEAYKAADRYKSKCLAVLADDRFSDAQNKMIGNIWYLNNERDGLIEKRERVEALKARGFVTIENDPSLNGKKVEFIRATSGDFLGGASRPVRGRLQYLERDKRLMIFEPRHTCSGYFVGENVYVRVL